LRRKALLGVLAVATIIVFLAFLFLVLRRPVTRAPMLPETAEEQQIEEREQPIWSVPPETWTASLHELQSTGSWRLLDQELTELATRDPERYAAWHFPYLHARVKIENGDLSGAAQLLEPYTVEEHPFRDLALYRRAEVAALQRNQEEAARYRETLISEHPDGYHRGLAIEEQVAWLEESGPPQELESFIQRVRPTVPAGVQRDLDARRIDALYRLNQRSEAASLAASLVRASIADDAAQRVLTFYQRHNLIPALPPAMIYRLGETARSHRHFDEAIQLLGIARQRLPAQRDEITFAIGRSWFGSDRFEEAEKVYLEGAAGSRDNQMRATFFFHASRCAQLLGDDARGEQHLNAALAIPGRHPATSAALTQRMRTRVRQGRWDEAQSDFATIQRLFPNSATLAEATYPLATAMIAAGRLEAADRLLQAVPARARNPFDNAEIAYWRARSLETRDPAAAVGLYRTVLRSQAPTHFGYFARQRAADQAVVGARNALLARLEQEAIAAEAAEQWETARRHRTDIALFSPTPQHLAELRDVYMRIPAYRTILELQPVGLPQIDADSPGDRARGEILMAIGLYDEATQTITQNYPLNRLPTALANAIAMNRGAASRSSIYAAEVMMRSVPEEFLPQLLPQTLRELLFPRYYYETIRREAERHQTDPRLVVAIMREESRFNPRAKSAAAARGLLQFIITTAREVGQSIGLVELEPDHLYDPQLIIRLGARYVADLMGEFDGNRYRAAAAYNAGPSQTRLWTRMAPAPGDDYFHSAVNFDETKNYVRKVMNSYFRYAEIYPD
jgi:soluble lytic murein transglycosylase-like protein